MKTSAAILAAAKLPECIYFIQAAKSLGRCCRQSWLLNLQHITQECGKILASSHYKNTINLLSYILLLLALNVITVTSH